ncbi:MAG: hypothetical protein ACPGNV_18100 [Mangrovicoccus sp.]
MSVGGSSGSGKSGSVSTDYVLPQQKYALSQLYNGTLSQFNTAGATSAAQSLAAQTSAPLAQTVSNLSGLTDIEGTVQAQANSLKTGLGNLFSQEINPAIESGAVLAGAAGSGRQGVAQGMAAGQIADAYAEGLGDIYSSARSSAVSGALAQGQLADSIYTQGRDAQTAGLDRLATLAQVIGSPSILSKTKSTTKNSSSGFSFGLT